MTPSVVHVLGVLEWSCVVPEKKLFSFFKIGVWSGFGKRPHFLLDNLLAPFPYHGHMVVIWVKAIIRLCRVHSEVFECWQNFNRKGCSPEMLG